MDINQILKKHGIRDNPNLIKDLEDFHELKINLFQKNRLDLLNWSKSELSQESNRKLGKTSGPYRAGKIKFLRRIIKWIE